MYNEIEKMAKALGVTKEDIIQCFRSEGFQKKEIKRLRLLIEKATEKGVDFRDKLLKDMAEWDRKKPKEPYQAKYEIYVSIEPKNH